MKKVSSFLCVLLILLSFSQFSAFADTLNTITISLTAEELEENPASVIEEALSSADLPTTKLVVNVPSGTYRLSKGLHIYSNTTLNLKEDTYIIRDFDDGSLIKTGVKSDVNTGYTGYQNITINGGVWDSAYYPQCGMRFIHCSNVTLKNFTLKNVKDSHHIEIGAADNLTISGCTFTGYQRTKNTSGEAVQIDPVHSEQHFKSAYELDDTPCKNITVKDCVFNNVFSGVGSRAGVIGSYFDNIKIINNTFNNITDKAICTFNYVNSQIKNNVITNATVGIFFEEYPTKNLTSKLYMPYDNDADKTIITNVSTVISGNTITVKKSSGYAQSCGIGIYGGVMSADTSKKYGLKKGNYTVENISVKNNTITTKTAASRGIDLKYVNSSKITSNTIKASVTASDGNCAVNTSYSNDNTISSNTVSGKFSSGILFANSSKRNILKSNTIKGASQYGLMIYSTSKAEEINSSNTISSCKKGAIYIKDAVLSVPQIDSKINAKSTKHKVKVSWKPTDKATGYIIYRTSKKGGTYNEIARVKSKKAKSYTDKTVKKNKTYYYKVAPYKQANSTVIYGQKTNGKSVKNK